MATASYEFYVSTYGGSLIPEGNFKRLANDSSKRVKMRLLGNTPETRYEDFENDLMSCQCEVAETLYAANTARGDNGLVMTAYSNDGESANFDASSATDDAIATRIEGIITKWLWEYGVLYRGCCVDA